MEGGKHRLQGDTLREANTSEAKTLKRENEELTHMFKDVSLELRVLKKKQHFRKIGMKYRRYKQEEKMEIIKIVDNKAAEIEKELSVKEKPAKKSKK